MHWTTRKRRNWFRGARNRLHLDGCVHLVDAAADDGLRDPPPRVPPVAPGHHVEDALGLGLGQVAGNGLDGLALDLAQCAALLDGDPRGVLDPLGLPGAVVGADQQLALVRHAPDRSRLGPAVLGEGRQKQVLLAIHVFECRSHGSRRPRFRCRGAGCGPDSATAPLETTRPVPRPRPAERAPRRCGCGPRGRRPAR